MHRPIPRFLLSKNILLYNRIEIDAYNKATYSDEIEVKRVYIESIKGSNNSSYGELSDCTLLIIFDLKNSSPVSVSFNELDKVIYDSKEYIVRNVEIFENHHIEVILK